MSRFKWPKPPMFMSVRDRLLWWSIPEPNSGCWLWFGVTGPSGYGRLCVTTKESKRIISAHRLSHEEFNGPVPNGMFVCHKCDNRACINPAHLFIGSALDNNRDMQRKGRQRHNPGERNGMAKLTVDKVLAIRLDIRALADIATDYGLSFQHVSEIKNGKRWKHVGGPIGHIDHRAGGRSRKHPDNRAKL